MPGPYPIRVAAIDVGSNAIRFNAAEFLGPATWLDLEVQRLPVRLGHNTFQTGMLDESTMTAAVEAMSAFRRSIDTLGIPRYRAVATSAVRESRNGGELVDRIRRECGIQLETITGTEEARLVWIAIRNRVDLGDRPWMAMDLGGGSLEVSLITPEGIQWTESHQMGTVRMIEDLKGREIDPDQYRTLLSEYARTLRIPDRVEGSTIGGLLGTGGNMEALALLADCPPDESGVSRVLMESFNRTVELLSAMPVADRISRLGLREDRADVILPAALIYGRVAELAGVDEIWVPHVGVKEGVLIDLVEDITGPSVHATQLEHQALSGALALGRRFQLDEPHGRHVARLSLSLFDQLSELHQCGPEARRMLLVAAALHDAGQFIQYRRHHKHSLYLIYNSDIPGISRDEVRITALIARYHRRSEPKDSHYLYAELDPEQRRVVCQMAAILRLADALDREHLQRVETVSVQVENDDVILEVRGHGDLLLEHWAFQKKAQMFERVFEKTLRLLVHEPEPGPRFI